MSSPRVDFEVAFDDVEKARWILDAIAPAPVFVEGRTLSITGLLADQVPRAVSALVRAGVAVHRVESPRQAIEPATPQP